MLLFVVMKTWQHRASLQLPTLVLLAIVCVSWTPWLDLRKPWKDKTQVEDQGLYLGLKHGREGRVPPGRCSRAPEESPIEWSPLDACRQQKAPPGSTSRRGTPVVVGHGSALRLFATVTQETHSHNSTTGEKALFTTGMSSNVHSPKSYEFLLCL